MTVAIQGETVVVTGASGFMGSSAVVRLSNDNDVHALVRDRAHAAAWHLPDHNIHGIGSDSLPVGETIASIQPSIVFHLATHYERRDPDDPQEMFDANVSFGAAVLVGAAKVERCRVVIAGSHFEYPPNQSVPVSLYAVSKLALLDIARYLQQTRGLTWIETVFYDVYGPRDPRDKFVGTALAQMNSGDEIRLPDPEPQHHFVHVDDAVEALVASAQQLLATPESIGLSVFATSNNLVTPSEVVALASSVLGVTPTISTEPFELPPNAVQIPVDGPRPLGWKPSIELIEGLEELAEGLHEKVI